MVHVPGWRNWQTRRTQNPVLAREWEFDPPSGHHQHQNVTPIKCEWLNYAQYHIVDGCARKHLDMMWSLAYSAREFVWNYYDQFSLSPSIITLLSIPSH